jgi:MFS family permease
MAVTPQPPLVEAFESMKRGALYLIIAWLLIGIGLMSVIAGSFTSLMLGFHGGKVLLVGSLVAMAIVLIVGVIIALIGLWGNFIPGTKRLAEVRPEFATSATLIQVGLFYGLIVMLIGALLVFVLIGIPIIIVGFILLILGYIGLIILSFKLNETEKNALYLAAGVMFIISIFVGLAGFIAWILLYIALGESAKKAKQAPPTPAPTPSTVIPPV